jgi:hypothetical protein
MEIYMTPCSDYCYNTSEIHRQIVQNPLIYFSLLTLFLSNLCLFHII